MSEPLVSIIICAYNAGEYLRESVASALGQTWENIEIILVDDGSTDGSMESIDDICDGRLRILRQANAGKPAALNRALTDLRGEFYAIQDADDLSHPQRVERLVGAMQENPQVAAVFSGHELIVNGRRMAPRARAKGPDECRRDIEAMRMPAHDPTGMYRFEYVRDLRYEESLLVGQGYDYILRVGEQFPILVIGETLYGYRIHTQSATKRDPGWRERMVRQVLRSACSRRGLNFDKLFLERPRATERNRISDNNVATDFLESAIDLRRAGCVLEALKTACACAAMHPTDPHYYKALAYVIAPPSWVTKVRAGREAKRRAHMVANE